MVEKNRTLNKKDSLNECKLVSDACPISAEGISIQEREGVRI